MIEIKSTLRESPIRAVIFGKDGLGKSTFCASAPRPVFIACEDGLSNIDALAVPTPQSWASIIESVDALGVDDRCGTIVIDSLDWAEQLCWSQCVLGNSSQKGIVLALVDAGLCCGEIVWLDGERAWEYEITPAGRSALARGFAI